MDEVVKRSLDEGVSMITVGTQSTTSRTSIELAEKYEGVWATIGLHPNHLHKQSFYDTDELPPEELETDKIKTRSESFDPDEYIELVSHPKVVAVGELGLDYYRIPEGNDRDEVIQTQKREATKQMRFASQFDKPIIVHCRDAHEDQYELLKNEIDSGGLAKKGVIHSFTGNAEDAEKYRELGFYIGLNGILMFSKELQETVKQIPLEQILIETDSPYLSPPPHRGKRNEPKNVKIIATFLAELLDKNLNDIAEMTTHNTETLFGIKA